ncbi:uncharacterized protein LOC116601367 isoform X2 [Nematostella vectensis]|uniref:uncharacterized protein LOC116601367 isoform X2 n=1 Tax=Nematostella vectensis TaxID=45351 RepID=UPI0020776519|nr:uncharacterized protein LOC116601367 isoform X2 [Nematostella vectensis]
MKLYLSVFLFISCQCVVEVLSGETLQKRRLLSKKVVRKVSVKSIRSCIDECHQEPRCNSLNFKLVGDVNCEMNEEDSSTVALVPDDYNIYYTNDKQKTKPSTPPPPEVIYRSCAELKAARPSTQSGNYAMRVRGFKRTIYCDMETSGGGWSLVVSISASSRNHILRHAHNCFNSSLCVPKESGTLPVRKHSDEDIRALAFYEGTFRLQVAGRRINYFRIVEGPDAFDAGCNGGESCPRIIVSFSYPYVWESNCFGVEAGYSISRGGCHYVFDTHDANECNGVEWRATHHSTDRILYSYCYYNGIYPGIQGYMYVR